MSLYMILIWTAFSGMRYENLEKHWKKTFTVAEENSSENSERLESSSDI